MHSSKLHLATINELALLRKTFECKTFSIKIKHTNLIKIYFQPHNFHESYLKVEIQIVIGIVQVERRNNIHIFSNLYSQFRVHSQGVSDMAIQTQKLIHLDYICTILTGCSKPHGGVFSWLITLLIPCLSSIKNQD
jgi:hypothetical protein